VITQHALSIRWNNDVNIETPIAAWRRETPQMASTALSSTQPFFNSIDFTAFVPPLLKFGSHPPITLT
jgi:hypothetical protein